MANIYPFAGGDILAKMGASWFVSYCYYNKLDKTHKNWTQIGTVSQRISTYQTSCSFHRAWLEEIQYMNPYKLKTNRIGLEGWTVQKMAKELLVYMKEEKAEKVSQPEDELLQKINPSWFVSYAYYQLVDRSHLKWNHSHAVSQRVSIYTQSKSRHKNWLEQIILMDEKSLKFPIMGLSGDEVKRMAQKLLVILNYDAPKQNPPSIPAPVEVQTKKHEQSSVSTQKTAVEQINKESDVPVEKEYIYLKPDKKSNFWVYLLIYGLGMASGILYSLFFMR